ncbi:uncharacterized protein LOC131327635 [Rhododendron vialii]|uniref:uncharacterized protein LOC131327635 n=1 Tax=Rhododendron vialii TaxID=182163 RepID=UPI00265FAE87|nr:uncharacterized protein LOC131327635 [Rhododendron vialii]
MTRTRAMKEFCKRRPPTFHGDTNPIVAETWLNEVKMILRTLGITRDGDRVALATYQLKGEARYSWDLMETMHTVAAMTFAEFETLFLSKYFPTPLRLAKEQEFLNLKQGTLTVTQYAAKHEELSPFTTYVEVVECALWLESQELDFKTRWRKANNNTGGSIRTQPPGTNRGPYPTKPSNLPQNNQPWKTTTPERGKQQRNGRDIETIQCYKCQAMAHYRQQCPQPQKERNESFGNQKTQQLGHTGFVKQSPGGSSQQQNGQNKGK